MVSERSHHINIYDDNDNDNDKEVVSFRKTSYAPAMWTVGCPHPPCI